MTANRSVSITDALNEAPLSRFHTRAVVTAGMGFFTDAYDLFIVGTASTLIAAQWHLSASATGLINSASLIAAFLGALAFGRIADIVGRKRIYGLEATLMAVGALASAFAPNLLWLIVFRFIMGIGVGGDYPVSAVLMSEYANRRNRGRLVGLVFSMQALGTVAGYVAGLALLSTGMSNDLVWRLLLGLGAVPAAAVIYLRRRMPESPRFLERIKGHPDQAASNLATYSDGDVVAVGDPLAGLGKISFGAFLRNRRYLLTLIGTAGTWFVFDYAYYGNAVSAPLIVKSVLGAGNHPLTQVLAFNLIVFTVAAVPGYYLAVAFMDRIGHRRLQIIGFVCMALAFGLIGVIPGITAAIVPFLVLFGISFFFAEFGPNTTTFVLSAESFPTSVRATAQGISAGVAKLGAFIGVFLFPIIQNTLGTARALELSAGFSLVGALLTLLIPETAQRSLEDISGEDSFVVAEAERIITQANLWTSEPPKDDN
ncbi:MAG: transporter, family, inorganic phosphate transporter [Kribbellaceae bacterium]|nr:transporter, family, inorganic phosphate transporter [Kribbellaceae bacterium]